MQKVSQWLELLAPEPCLRFDARCSRAQQTPLKDVLVTEMQQQHCLGWSVEHRTNMHKQVVVVEAQHPSVPIEAHGCCSALCLLWLQLWAAGPHSGLPTKWSAYPTYSHQDHVKLCLQCLLDMKPIEEKYWEVQQMVQMAVHEVPLWVRAILEKPLPMHWMHNLNIQMLGELLQLHPAIVISEFCKVSSGHGSKL